MLCSFLIAFGDACFNTQVLSILGSIYASDSAPAFALFKFVQVRSFSLYQVSCTRISFNCFFLVDRLCHRFLLFAIRWHPRSTHHHRHYHPGRNYLLLVSRVAQCLQTTPHCREGSSRFRPIGLILLKEVRASANSMSLPFRYWNK